MQQNTQLEDLISTIINLDSVWSVNYYLSCMKKQPHGGVAHVTSPNYYIKYFHKQLFRLFVHNPYEVAFFMEDAVEEVLILAQESEIDIDIILKYFCDTNFWYVGYRILKSKLEYKEKQDTLFHYVVENNLSYKEYFEIDEKIVLYAFLCYLLDCNNVEIFGLQEIESHEKLNYEHNKYGLSNISNANFKRQGFIFDEKYFLYNIFFDTSIITPLSDVPSTVQIIFLEISEPKFEMRLDNNLAVPVSKMVSTATIDSQVFRGIKLNLENVNKLVNKKEIIIHYCPETMNKLILIVKEDYESGNPFYHIEVEELWNPDSVTDDFVTTNFIHAKYYPTTESFNHIDFSVNQYKRNIYYDKYTDSPNNTGISIDKYCDIHYKVWCVEADFISIDTWSKLVAITLDEPFRELYFEMIDSN